MNPSISPSCRQWLWFAALWVAGFSAMGILAAAVRFFMNLIYGQG
jgi:hypothetical protein